MRLNTIYFKALVLLVLLLFQSNYSYAESSKLLSEQLLLAIESYHLNKAISVANKLISKPLKTEIDKQFIKIAEREGIKGSFFTAPFNFWDFQLWRHALFFKRLSEKITKKDPNSIEMLFDSVRKRIEPREGKSARAPWAYWVWQRGFGACDRSAWVFCELAYQKGWETQIVILRDPKTKISPHTMCELRKSTSNVCFADPQSNILFKNKSISEVASDATLLQSIWSDHPNYRTAIKDCVFYTPSYPQDYCPRNQELQRVLKQNLGYKCPRFGIPPKKRLEKYKMLGQKTIFDQPPYPMDWWFYPFRLLRSDIIRYIKQFGVNFLK